MWLKMRSVEVCFGFLLSVQILNHSIYVNSILSGITKAKHLYITVDKRLPAGIMITTASVVELPNSSNLRTPENSVRQCKFPEIQSHKNH